MTKTEAPVEGSHSSSRAASYLPLVNVVRQAEAPVEGSNCSCRAVFSRRRLLLLSLSGALRVVPHRGTTVSSGEEELPLSTEVASFSWGISESPNSRVPHPSSERPSPVPVPELDADPAFQCAAVAASFAMRKRLYQTRRTMKVEQLKLKNRQQAGITIAQKI